MHLADGGREALVEGRRQLQLDFPYGEAAKAAGLATHGAPGPEDYRREAEAAARRQPQAGPPGPGQA